MRITVGLILGAGIVLAAHFWARPTAWMLTRIPPSTPTDSAPRFRTWHNGVEVTN